MIDLQFLGFEKKCFSCACLCESGESFCSSCGENLKQRTAHYR
ncbi:MAG: hypothetical protein AABX70_02760 [Nanoarchaeota archaeon]